MKDLYTATTIGYDQYGEPFVNTYESTRYPFYGSQFHPEKAAYVFSPGFNLEHHDDYINLNRHFSEFFVQEARKNSNHYDTYHEERKHLVENYDCIVLHHYLGEVYMF